MTTQWILSNFSVDESGNAMIPVGHGASIAVPVSTMIQWWGNTPLTHAALSATPQASEGWQSIFDYWKSEGLIS